MSNSLSDLNKVGWAGVICLTMIVPCDTIAAEVKPSRKSYYFKRSSREILEDESKPLPRSSPSFKKSTQEMMDDAPTFTGVNTPLTTTRSNIEKQKYYLDSAEKAILLSTYDDYIKTYTGKQLMTELSKVKFEITSQQSIEGWIPGFITGYRERYFDIPKTRMKEAVEASTPEEKQIAKLRLAESFTYAASSYMTETMYAPGASFAQRSMNLRMMMYLHPVVLSLVVQDQMMDASDTPVNLNKLEKKDPRLAFYRRLKTAKMKEGSSASDAALFARGTVAEKYWGADTSSVEVNGRKIAPSHDDIEKWARASFAQSFMSSPELRKTYIKDKNQFVYTVLGNFNAKEINIDATLNNILKPLGLSKPLSFFKEKDSTTYTPKTAELKIDGKMNSTFDFLNTGIFSQRFDRDGSISGFVYYPYTNPAPSTGTEYYPGTETPKFTYTVNEKGQLTNTTIKMFAPDGAPMAEIPINENGKVAGLGLLWLDGEKTKKGFSPGNIEDIPVVNTPLSPHSAQKYRRPSM